MKRVVCGLLLGAAAFTTTPATAYEYPPYGVKPHVWTGEHGRYGVGASYTTDGDRYYPVGGAYVQNGAACVGFSYQIPFCVGAGPIAVDPPR